MELISERGRKTIRIAVYVMLVLSAGAAFLVGDKLWTAARLGEVPMWLPLVPPVAFTAFVIVYTIDRWALVRRRKYPVGRAFFQVAFALVFLSLLWPQQAAEFRESKRPQTADYALRLLTDQNPDARSAACELLGLRAQADAAETIETLAQNDPDDRVRETCSEAVGRLRAVGQTH